jgi:hypothetical protein
MSSHRRATSNSAIHQDVYGQHANVSGIKAHEVASEHIISNVGCYNMVYTLDQETPAMHGAS